MGMYCTLTQIAEDELQRIRSDPAAIPPLLRRKEATPPPPTSQATPLGSSDRPTPTVRLVSLEKMWQALHFLLTGEPFGGTPPLSLAILGGHPLDEQEEGSNIVLEPSEVEAVATALSGLKHEDLDRRFEPAQFAAAGIYPGVWDEDRGELLAELTGYFDELVAFYRDAARCGSAVLIDVG
jgi:hypothetical protein